jgi:hypothetical protein
MSVQMELHKIIISEMQEQQIIVLKEVDGERKFPIVIGNSEAYAIDRRLKGHPTTRPLTHDLLANVIDQMGGTISRIEINNLQDHTFFARIHIRQNGHTCEIDSWELRRPCRFSWPSTSWMKFASLIKNCASVTTRGARCADHAHPHLGPSHVV